MGRPGLTRHRKFARLARLLDSEPLARGALELVWEVAYENGDDLLGDADDVEHAARWKGKRGGLARALVAAEFLDRDAEGLHRVHDLWDHAPDYVRKRRVREREREAKGATLEGDRSVTGQRPGGDRSVTAEREDSRPRPRSRPRSHTRPPAPQPPPADGGQAGDEERRLLEKLSEALGRRVAACSRKARPALEAQMTRLGFDAAVLAAVEVAEEMAKRGNPLRSLAALPGWLKTVDTPKEAAS